MGIKVLKANCDPNDAADKSLPYTAYLVEYKQDGKPVYDIAIGDKAVDLFDYYYDLYKENFVSMMQAEGRVAPNMWKDPAEKAKKPKKKR